MIKFIEKARNTDADTFLSMTRMCRDILKDERHKGIVDAKIDNGLIELNRKSVTLIGDLHGDLEALEIILRETNFFDSNNTLLFLGDYGDRGKESVEVYHLILNLKIIHPSRIILLRGNHECPTMPFVPHDLPSMLHEKFGRKANEIYKELTNIFDLMYNAAIKDRYLILHGGVPVNITSRKDLSLPNTHILEQILWNDPKDDLNGFIPSLRGYGYFFGKDVTINALRVIDASVIIRSHEPCNGYKINHEGLVLTIFSCKTPYGNKHASYLSINDSDKLLDNVKIF